MKELPVVTRNFDRIVALKSKHDLTTIVNQIIAVEQAIDVDWEFGQAMGAPSECYADIYRNHKQLLRDMIAKAGFINARVLLEVIKNRTSAKFVYFSQLHCLYEIAADEK